MAASRTAWSPPPAKTASAGGRSWKASGARPGRIRTRTWCAAALLAIRPHWSWSASTAMTWAPKRAHSMAAAPEPAPTSHTVWPGPGPRRARTSARTSALVIIEPRWAKAGSARPRSAAGQGECADLGFGDHRGAVGEGLLGERPAGRGALVAGRPAGFTRLAVRRLPVRRLPVRRLGEADEDVGVGGVGGVG